ncbi:MAG: tyrosine-type recombinase/integrase [Elusimicrobia bacterium]|nr:tyrosine-type recombinase/integrase [Elusimicrobiota bacterium]
MDRKRIQEYIHEAPAPVRSPGLIRKISALRSFLGYLVEEGKLSRNLLSGLRFPKREKRLPQFLTEREVVRLLSSPVPLSSPLRERDCALLELLYSSGLRREEVCRLDIPDVDFFSGFVRVMGKGSRERLVPVGQTALAALRAYLEARAMTFHRQAPLFVSRKGGRLTPDSIFLIVKRWARAARFARNITPHTFRHSFATHLLDRGCDLKSVQEMLGHRSLGTTQIYTHVTLERLKKVYEKSHPRSF